MSVFVPISHDAVVEARKMMPSKNLLSESTGKVVYAPTLESALGIYKLGVTGKDSGKKFFHPGEVIDAVRDKKIHMNDVVQLGRNKVTAGRILIASVLPEAMQHDVLTNHQKIDKNGLGDLLTKLAKEHGDEYGTVVNKLKDLGNQAAFGPVALPTIPDGHALNFTTVKGYNSATIDPKKKIYIPMDSHTLSLKDFVPDKKVREHVLTPARKKVEAIYADMKIPEGDKDRRAIEIWSAADEEMRKLHEEHEKKNPSNLFQMYQAKVKPDWNQYK